MLSFDEKLGIQAHNHTQHSMPLYRGRRRTRTHDDKRYSRIHLQTWQDRRTGHVFGHTTRWNRSEDCAREMNQMPRQLPGDAGAHHPR